MRRTDEMVAMRWLGDGRKTGTEEEGGRWGLRSPRELRIQNGAVLGYEWDQNL